MPQRISVEYPTYIPGRHPHPRSRGSEPLRQDPSPLGLWREGWALFESGYYWEAHECWEMLWLHLGRTTEAARVVQALILVAAAGVKVRQRRPRIALRLLGRARDKLIGVSDSVLTSFGLGEDLSVWLLGLDAKVSRGVAEENEQPVRVVFPVVLSRGAAAGLNRSGE